MTQKNFSDFGLHDSLLRGIRDLGFTDPTRIQSLGVPPALEGRDVLACAMTGSGKTAAFLLPILQRLIEDPPRKGSRSTRALILTPTRELAAQIVEQFDALAKHTPFRAAAVYGGVKPGPQIQAFRSGVELIVACPGRLLDHMGNRDARFDDLDVLVLDEVDRMLDMGFLPDVRRILKQLPEVDQSLFYSATLAPPIARLAEDLLVDPAKLQIERQATPANGIEQTLWPVGGEQKRLLLAELISRDEVDQALVFTRTKHRANRLAQFLVKRGISADRIHGNRTQSQRTKALASFKSGETRILVATDIAARGIDVSALSHVVNFDVPNVTDDYIHRIGRTARASATGDALTFVSPAEENDVRAIERVLKRRLPRKKLPDFAYDQAPQESLEIPVRDRIAAARAARGPGKGRGGAKPQGQAPRGPRSSAAEPAEAGRRRRRGRAGQPAREDAGRPSRRRGGAGRRSS